MDSFSRWPEVYPFMDISVETTAKVYFRAWISCFSDICKTNDQGWRFQSDLFCQLMRLQAAIRCHGGYQWVEALPAILLGLHSSWKEDNQTTLAEVVSRGPKTFKVQIGEHEVVVVINRIKPVYVAESQEPVDSVEEEVNVIQPSAQPSLLSVPPAPPVPITTTRSGRRVCFPKKLENHILY
ncbi:hypothetical protein J437_LFUL005138 [Ladona fulva]|uniref:Uncharacterized protein n=1 Tax=Ladona fulva TaxID=123851 RepID=A0A8K0P5L4_LADFU|nr:hypothetical protein J437_LFUL005138 [Ladona fulva]